MLSSTHMSKPTQLKTRLFLDSGVPEETKEVIIALGFLDGQTTNPTLIAQNLDRTTALPIDRWESYKGIVREISRLVPEGSVSIEVYADHQTTAEEMITKGLELHSWIPNAHIKLPITKAGLTAARELVTRGLRVNMTLCFSQEQAAAVYAATMGAPRGNVFLSPFVGRLDDIGQNGMDLIKNILKMFRQGDGHVEVLVASVRTYDHFIKALQLQADIITSPLKLLKE